MSWRKPANRGLWTSADKHLGASPRCGRLQGEPRERDRKSAMFFMSFDYNPN